MDIIAARGEYGDLARIRYSVTQGYIFGPVGVVTFGYKRVVKIGPYIQPFPLRVFWTQCEPLLGHYLNRFGETDHSYQL